MNFPYWLSSYCVSPSVSTAARFGRSSAAVAAWAQFDPLPRPALKNPEAGSQAMSPAAAITGSFEFEPDGAAGTGGAGA